MPIDSQVMVIFRVCGGRMLRRYTVMTMKVFEVLCVTAELSAALSCCLFSKHKSEAIVMEVNLVRNEVVHALNNLYQWMKPERVRF